MEIREVKIEEYWPLIVKNTEEFGQIAVAENPEFNQLAECIYRVLKDGFIHDATEYGVSRWERMLGLAVTDGATLDNRKVAILNYLSVKMPYTWRVLKQMLTGLLGEDKFEISLDNDTQTLSVDIHNDVLSKLDHVKELSNRVIPQNLVVEYDSYPLPIGYTRLEYLENTATKNCIYFDLPFTFDDKTTIEYSTTYPQVTSGTYYPRPFGGAHKNQGHIYDGDTQITAWHATQYVNATGVTQSTWAVGTSWTNVPITRGVKNTIVLENGKITLNGQSRTSAKKTSAVSFIAPYQLWGWGRDGGSFIGRFYSFKHERNGQLLVNLVPALDNTTGTPCMFDTVTKKPLWNQGVGDFTYAGKEEEPTTYSLRNRMYAQYTEHGIRRLYRVPDGYNSKEEYAEQNGFKLLVETPMPEEGYWIPVWHDREDCIELEWVEAEPPVEEEVIENE